MEFIDEKLLQYAEAHTSEESAVLQALNRETNAKVLAPRMLSGHLQGRFLAMISQMIKPGNILEIGTYTGYSAICLAEGLKPKGKLITIDINDEPGEMVERYVDKAGLAGKADQIIGNALEIIPELKLKFDLVFIDADKENYSRYYDLVFDKVNNGGFIVADNVLWSGHVIEPESTQDHETKCIVEFNQKVKNDIRVTCMLLPLRDGLMLIQKK
jgi:predicted O-methyltransferase YrrM